MSEKIFCLRPRYVSRFQCDGSKCGALCCRSDWSIYIDAKTYEKYCALPEAAGHLREDGGQYLIVPTEKNICPFLGADNLCRLQKAHGEDYLSSVCASYPRILTRFDNFLELALSPTCPVAAELILFDTAPLKFEVVAADDKILRLGANNVLTGIPRELAPLVFNVQLIMIAILQNRRLTLNQRLIVLGFFLDKVEELLGKGLLDAANLKALLVGFSSENFMTRQLPLLFMNVHFDERAHERFMLKITAELFGEPLPFRAGVSVNKFAVPLENLLVNEVILNMYPWRINAPITRNFGVFVTIYKIFERLIISKGVRNVEELLSVAGDFSHQIDHSDDFIPRVAAQVDGDALTLIEKLLRV